jgi:hypothetical protein
VTLGAMLVVAAAEDELRSHLDSGEKLLWAGRPAPGIVLTRQDGYLILFGVLLLAAGLRYIPMGIYILIVGRLFAELWYRSRLIYGVTDRRAIILSGMRRRSMQSIYFSSVITLKLDERRNRSGTIYFGEDHPSSSYWRHAESHGQEFGPDDGIPYVTRLGELQFFRIADAKKVYTISLQAIRRQRRRSSEWPIRR